MYIKIYPFDVMTYLKSGHVVNVTDRQKGETLYVNGMNMNEYASLMKEAEADKTGRFDFYVYEQEDNNENKESS